MLIIVLLVTAGCGWPSDAGGTLVEVEGGVLRVGVTENPPWSVLPGDGEPRGAEVVLVQRLADRLDARVEWYPGSESVLMAALKDRVLALVIGGLTAQAPWTESASFSRPYVTMRTVVAAAPGVPVPADLDGIHVAVEAGTLGVPVIATRVGALPEVFPDQILFVDSGEDGLPELPSMRNAVELVEPVWGRRLQERVEELCSKEAVVARYLEVLRPYL